MEIDTLIIPLTTITNDNWRGKVSMTNVRCGKFDAERTV